MCAKKKTPKPADVGPGAPDEGLQADLSFDDGELEAFLDSLGPDGSPAPTGSPQGLSALQGHLAHMIDELDDEARSHIIEDFTLALLYLSSTRAGGDGARRAKKGMSGDALKALAADGLIEPPRQGPVTITGAGCVEALMSIIAFSNARQTIDDQMDALRESIEGPMRAFRLRVELELWPGHPCWRELVVPAYFTFAMLHQVIQSAFLWWDYHCYEFTLTSHGERLLVADPDAGGVDAMFAGLHGGAGREVNASELYLDDVFPRTRTARYVYDYGDFWEHRIRLVETIEDYQGDLPACLGGEGDAPPEDVGSADGFENFLRVIADKADPEHDGTVAWGEDQFFEPFSLEAVSERMRKWPTGELFDERSARNGQ